MANSLREAFLGVGIGPVPVDEPLCQPEPLPEMVPRRNLDTELRFLLDQGLASGSLVAFSRHAVKRYRERFEPDCDLREAKRRLYARLHGAIYLPERPRWLVHVPKVRDPARIYNVGYLLIDGEVVLPLRDNIAPALPGLNPPQPLAAVTTLYRV